MLARVFPRRTSLTPTDDMAFIGPPPLLRPEATEVHVSCAFTWDRPFAEYLAEAWRQYYPVVKVGGPAFDDPGMEFEPGLYVRKGVVITSRGCRNQCPWCQVWRRDGKLRQLEVKAGNNVLDDNLLECDCVHQAKVFAMLRKQHRVELTGGLEPALVTDWVAEELRSIPVKQVFLACDAQDRIPPLIKALAKLTFLGRNRTRCYVLIGFNGETLADAEARLMVVWECGAMPFAQLYQPPHKWIDYSDEWKDLARTWSRPAAMVTRMKERPHKRLEVP